MKTHVNMGSLLLFFSIHFNLVDANLFFTISIILICSLGLNVHLSQQNTYCNQAYYLKPEALSSNNFPLPLTVPLSVIRGRSYFKETKEHSSICVKTAKVYLFEHIQ